MFSDMCPVVGISFVLWVFCAVSPSAWAAQKQVACAARVRAHMRELPVTVIICGPVFRIRAKCMISRRRPYRVECTGSLLTSEVKQHRARLVLGWGAAWGDLRVLSAFSLFLRIRCARIIVRWCPVLRNLPVFTTSAVLGIRLRPYGWRLDVRADGNSRPRPTPNPFAPRARFPVR